MTVEPTMNPDSPAAIAAQIERLQRQLATVQRSGELVKFRHASGSVVLTRDPATYRKLLDWIEMPFDISSPVPRMPR